MSFNYLMHKHSEIIVVSYWKTETCGIFNKKMGGGYVFCDGCGDKCN